ncbi:hypothetical protein C6500_05410 [Candidatus Poribacteria bacterium]|nr:MAG: hypothetical protein C6500_05410 [Candidatus Poribacteria bacterium]
MRFLMINLLLVCLLLFGIGYLAFGYDETVVPAERRDHHTEEKPWGTFFETFHKLLKTDADLDLS